MTNEEAIQFLKNMKGEEAGRAIGKEGFYAELLGYHIEALDTAIESLKNERPQGKWITVYFKREELNVPQKASMFDFVKCPFCETIHQGRHHFCSWCGADMRGDNNDAT